MSGHRDTVKGAARCRAQQGRRRHSRRWFIRKAVVWTTCGACLASAPVVFALQGNGDPGSQAAFSPARHGAPPQAKGHIARVSNDMSTCASCGLCTMVCAAVHGGETSPSLAGIWLHRDSFACVYDSIACKQCDAPECYDACKADGGGAMFIHPVTGARAIDPSKCLGCKACMEACVFSPPRISFDAASNKAFKCDLCSHRPEGPACVEFCPHRALVLTREPGA